MRKLDCVIGLCVMVLGAAVYGQETGNEGGGASAWSHAACASVSVPVYSMKLEQAGKASVCGISGNLSYVGTASGGFTVKGDLGSGVLLSCSFQPLYETETPVCAGWGVSGRIGAGYSFIRTDRLQLAVLGTVGADYMLFAYNKKIVSYAMYGEEKRSHTTTQTQNDNLLMFSFGAECFASYRLTEKISVFADVNAVFPYYGKMWTSGNYMGTAYSSEDTMRGYVIVTPSAGVMFHF